MSAPTITDTGPPLGKEDLDKLERKIGARLPGAYRKFLLEYNGGKPTPPFFGRNVLAAFLGVNLRDKTYDLLASHKRIKTWLPGEILPVAWDEFGNSVCLAVKGKRRGKVYFWDHEGGTEQLDWEAILPGLKLKPYAEDEPRPSIKDDWPGHPDLTLIANSFTEFLESFHDEPELDDEPEPEPEDEPPEPEDDDEPPGPPLEPAVWLLPGKPRKATTSKAKGGSKTTKAKPRARKATKARSRDKG